MNGRARTRPTPDGRFLIVRLSALGDVLHALPAVVALRRERPRARIDWIVEDRFASALAGHPAIDALHVVPRRRWRRALARPWAWPALLVSVGRFVGRVWARRFDASIDLQGNLRSGVWSLLSGAPTRVGYRIDDVREGNAFFTNRRVRVPVGIRHRVERGLALVGAAIGRGPLRAEAAPLPRSDAERAWVDRALREAGVAPRGFDVLHPGTSRFGTFKRWPAERYGRLSRRLAGAGPRTVVTVGPGEEILGREVAAAARGTAVVLAPPSLGALAELVSRARVFVSADTGPLHVAAGEGTAVVGLFGPKDATIYGPYRPPSASAEAGAGVVVTQDAVPCRPCALRRCPDPVCMSGIGVDAALDGIRRALTP